MTGIVSFIRSVILFALGLALAGTLLEATGWVGREAVHAHQKGGISFRWLNRQLVGSGVKLEKKSSGNQVRRSNYSPPDHL